MFIAYRFVLFFVALLVAGSTSAFVVTGVQGGVNSATGQRPFRQEILTFRKSGPAWDLYIQALQQFQQTNQSDQLSYYQVAGIHGRPFIAWDGVAGTRATGYCTHNSILFGPWHRAYVALFEQIIWKNAQTIAASYPPAQRAAYQAAATNLRIPYWDWAAFPKIPDITTTLTITINTPSGKQTIANPLKTYNFNPKPANNDFPSSDSLAKYTKTVRTPDSAGADQNGLVCKQLVANSLRDRTYLLIARQSNYAAFSNTGYSGTLRQGSFDSLEGLHNQIHGLVGGAGHMGIVSYGSFDPIFWLHHANVDRLDAIWGAINPDSYVTAQTNAMGTFTEASGTVEDINTPLTPFRRDAAGNMHTAITARYTKAFGYTYPEILDWGVTTAQLSSNVRAAFKKLYDPTNRLSARDTSRSLRRRSASPQDSTTASTTMTSTESATPSPTAAPANRQWFINLSVNRNALASSFFVHFFLGAPPTDTSTWSTASNLVGSHVVFAGGMSAQNIVPTMGQVPVTTALNGAVAAGALADLSVESVEEYLKDNLQYRVQKLDGTVVPVNRLKDLKVSVVDQVVEGSGRLDQFGTYGVLNGHVGLTWG